MNRAERIHVAGHRGLAAAAVVKTLRMQGCEASRHDGVPRESLGVSRHRGFGREPARTLEVGIADTYRRRVDALSGRLMAQTG